MSYLPFILMNAIILGIIAYVLMGTISDERDHRVWLNKIRRRNRQ